MVQRVSFALGTLLASQATAEPWDNQLLDPIWRARQRSELAAAFDTLRSGAPVPEVGRSALKPCPRTPVTPELPQTLPLEVARIVANVRDELNDIFAKSNVTGGVASLVYGDRVLLTHGYGLTERSGSGSKTPEGSTVFRLGSISKVFTDLMLYQRHETGALSLDDPIVALAPEYKPAWPRGKMPTARGGTLRDLASHMAGLARYMPCNFGSTCDISLEEALHRVSNWTLLYEPGARLAYSNTGFSLLGHMLARHEDSTYKDLLATLVQDLGLETTSLEPPANLSQMAFGYDTVGGKVPLMDLGISNPAGGIFSTADDIAKLMSFLLRDGTPRGPGQPLDSATVRSWLNTRVWQNPSVIPEGVWFTSWGAPWEVLNVNLDGITSMANFSRYYLVSKSGSIPGYNAQMVFQPDLRIGLFAAMTTGPSGRSVPFFSDILAELGLRIAPAMLAWLSTVQPTMLPPSPSDYIGHYATTNAFGNYVEIGLDPSGSLGNTTLYILRNDIGLPPLQPIAFLREDTFEMVPLPSDVCWTIEGGENYALHFTRHSDSKLVAALAFEGRGEYPEVLLRRRSSSLKEDAVRVI